MMLHFQNLASGEVAAYLAYSAMVGGDSIVAGLLPPPDDSVVTPGGHAQTYRVFHQPLIEHLPPHPPHPQDNNNPALPRQVQDARAQTKGDLQVHSL